MYIATYNCIRNMRNQLTEVVFNISVTPEKDNVTNNNSSLNPNRSLEAKQILFYPKSPKVYN